MIFEVVAELAAELVAIFFVEIIFKRIIVPTFNFFKKGLNYIWCTLTGNKKTENST